MKTWVRLVLNETKEEIAVAELSKTRIERLVKSYEKAGWPVTVELKEAA